MAPRRPPAQLQRRVPERLAPRVGDLRRPLQRPAVRLDKVLVVIPFALKRGVAPAAEKPQPRLAVAAGLDVALLVVVEVEIARQLAGGKVVAEEHDVAVSRPARRRELAVRSYDTPSGLRDHA